MFDAICSKTVRMKSINIEKQYLKHQQFTKNQSMSGSRSTVGLIIPLIEKKF